MPVKKAVKKTASPKVANMFDSQKAVSLLVLLLALSTLSYFWWSSLKNKAAATVNGDVVTMRDYQRNFEGMKKFRESQGENFSSADNLKKLRQETIDTLVSNTVVIQQAKANDIIVTQADLDNDYTKRVEANTNGDESKFKEQIKNLYGFTPEEYKFYYLKAALYESKLQEKVTKDDSYKKSAKDAIENAYSEITNGTDFSAVVAKYSEDELSKANKGDMGWLKRGQAVKAFEDVAFSLEKGNVSKVFEDIDGFHVIKVTDKKNTEVKVSQVLTVVQSFDKWVAAKVKESSVKILVSI